MIQMSVSHQIYKMCLHHKQYSQDFDSLCRMLEQKCVKVTLLCVAGTLSVHQHIIAELTSTFHAYFIFVIVSL